MAHPQAILKKMEGCTVAQHKFSRADQIKSLASATYITHNGVTLEIDPWAIYQRFVVAGLGGEIGIDLMFEFELCSYTASLFDKNLRMREPDKGGMMKALLKKTDGCVVTLKYIKAQKPKNVLDGCGLLHKIPWQTLCLMMRLRIYT